MLKLLISSLFETPESNMLDLISSPRRLLLRLSLHPLRRLLLLLSSTASGWCNDSIAGQSSALLPYGVAPAAFPIDGMMLRRGVAPPFALPAASLSLTLLLSQRHQFRHSRSRLDLLPIVTRSLSHAAAAVLAMLVDESPPPGVRCGGRFGTRDTRHHSPLGSASAISTSTRARMPPPRLSRGGAMASGRGATRKRGETAVQHQGG